MNRAAGEPERVRLLAVRPMVAEDIPHIVRYWTHATPMDLDRMSVDPTKIPPPDVLRVQLEELLAPSVAEVRTFYLVWLIDGRPVGYSALKNIRRGDRAEMHLHMWDVASRGRGYGPTLFCQSALDFYERFQLKEIVCEPSRSNALPNAMLQRIGFPLLGRRVGISSELSAVCDLNTYKVHREVARRYLASAVRTG